MDADKLREWEARRRAAQAFDALPTPGRVDLTALSDHELSAITREREVAYQDALGEAERRRAEKGNAAWDEAAVASALALKRRGEEIPNRVRFKIGELPPALFRMGYEWATITILDVLSGFIARPSGDIAEITEFEPAYRDLWRISRMPTKCGIEFLAVEFRRRTEIAANALEQSTRET